MTYQEAVQYLSGLTNFEKKEGYNYTLSFKLERMRNLCSHLGDPQKDVRSIHVAGTKGKGSTCALIYSILRSAGYKTGLYTSPHLVSFRERIKINDKLITEDDVGSVMETVKNAVDEMEDKPTFFEIFTTLAYIYFKREKADFVVYEVGLGGRLDATNVIEPLSCAITPISYEHTNILGETIPEIAREKAGIIKDGSICVSAPQGKEALGAIEDACRAKDAKLLLVGRDIKVKETAASDEEEVFNVSGIFGSYNNLHMKLLGCHQVINAGVAIGVIEALRFSGISVGADAIKKGVESARWPGRLEIVRKRSPRIVLDGAQNRASADALAKSVKRLFKYGKLILILGVSKDKDIKGILSELVPISDHIILTKSEVSERAMDPEHIRAFITPKSKDVSVTQNVDGAIRGALAKAQARDLVLITGSLFVVGDARKILVKDESCQK